MRRWRECWYDLIVILDDASSEIYYAQLVEEESTQTVMAGLKEVVERKGVFCALYSDRGSHFWLTPKVGGKVDPPTLSERRFFNNYAPNRWGAVLNYRGQWKPTILSSGMKEMSRRYRSGSETTAKASQAFLLMYRKFKN